MELNLFEMLIRTTFAFFAILLLARIIGKKQISQLTFFHYVTGITFGSIAAEISAQAETPFLDGLVSLIWWTVLTIFVTYLTFKSSKARVLFDDRPMIVIQSGVILNDNLEKARLHMDEVTMLLREQSIFSLDEVHHAIFETNGELTVLKKPLMREVTKEDLKIASPAPQYMPTELVSDGKIIVKNLNELNLTEDWLLKKLSKKNIHSVEDVYYAQILENGSLYTSIKNASPPS
ncbi:YetF domain-containing protein [Solibacillus cecembensis]|uniref:YetF domain-containing protein n=1 Tax=Solibacillus cecembensis TaxID=459347 RepID=UPI003CFD2833